MFFVLAVFTSCFFHSVSFLFLAHRDYFVLFSFPTRRSSDLQYYERRAQTNRGDDSASYSSDACVRPPKPGITTITGDRKSTRLNSSHVAISYAVFCLKKKKSLKLASAEVNFCFGTLPLY